MNKLVIPTILLATVMVAGIFAFSPIDEATTVHTTGTITVDSSDSNSLNVSVFNGEVSEDIPTTGILELILNTGGTSDVTIDIFVTDNLGVPVTGLVAADFTFIEQDISGGDNTTVDTTTFAEVGSGLYTFGADADDGDYGDDADIDEFVICAIIDDTDDGTTDLEGASCTRLTVITNQP